MKHMTRTVLEMGIPPAVFAGFVATMFLTAGLPSREKIDANNAVAISEDLVRVTLPTGEFEIQRVTNGLGIVSQADLQAYLNRGYVRCVWFDRDALGRKNISCRDWGDNPVRGIPIAKHAGGRRA